MISSQNNMPGSAVQMAALDSLDELVAVMQQERVLFANCALVLLQGCNAEGSFCRMAGKTPCPECIISMARDNGHIVQAEGRTFESYSKPIQAEDEDLLLLVWHELTMEPVRLLKGQYDKMRRDIFHARNVQTSLLPSQLARADGYYFDSLYRPCEEMSGDIFDLFRIGRDNIAFYIADVVGHGVTAAMLTVFFSTAVRMEMRPTEMPGRVLTRVHKRFIELGLDEHQYITAFLGRLEISTGKLYWSNAGHICPPLLVDDNGDCVELEMAGLPISRWFDEQEYETMHGMMRPGASLAVYSDGLESLWMDVPQAQSLQEYVAAALHANQPQQCLEAIWRGAGAGQSDRPLRDDTTLLLMHRFGGDRNEVQA